MIEEEVINQLTYCPLFQGIDAQEIEKLLENSGYKLDSYGKNDIVALIGYPCNHLLIILKGTLIARMVSDSGKFVDIEKMGVGKVLAPAMLFADDNVFPVNVLPEEDVVLFKIKKEKFLEWMQNNAKMLSNFIRLISNVNRFLSQKIHFLSLKSLRGKIAEYLITLSEQDNNSSIVSIPLTRQDMADKFGVSRQSLIRSLSELEALNFIKVEGRNIKLLDVDALMAES